MNILAFFAFTRRHRALVSKIVILSSSDVQREEKTLGNLIYLCNKGRSAILRNKISLPVKLIAPRTPPQSKAILPTSFNIPPFCPNSASMATSLSSEVEKWVNMRNGIRFLWVPPFQIVGPSFVFVIYQIVSPFWKVKSPKLLGFQNYPCHWMYSNMSVHGNCWKLMLSISRQ